MKTMKMAGTLIRCAALAAVFAAGAAERKIGIIGLDTSHVIRFTDEINIKKPDWTQGFRVVAAYKWGSKDIVSSTNRYPKYMKEISEMGVEIVPSIRELLDKVDCVLLETNDGREHLAQALEVFAAGKPVFIDKPLAADYADCAKIVAAGRKAGAKWFCSSGLRFKEPVCSARAGRYGKIKGAAYSAPSPFEEQGTHSDYYWYGIHGFEPLVTMMGAGVDRVSTLRSEQADLVSVVWKDGRTAQLRCNRKGYRPYGGYMIPERPKKGEPGIVPIPEPEGGYQPILQAVLKFFETGVPPVDADETLEIYALMSAAAKSAREGGRIVTLDEIRAEVR